MNIILPIRCPHCGGTVIMEENIDDDLDVYCLNCSRPVPLTEEEYARAKQNLHARKL